MKHNLKLLEEQQSFLMMDGVGAGARIRAKEAVSGEGSLTSTVRVVEYADWPITICQRAGNC